MKASELRIGNHIQCLDDILTVEYLDKLLVKGNYHRDAVWNTSVQLKHCKPIPLTEEWLLEFGFKNNRLGLFDCVKVVDDIGYHIYFIGKHLKEVQYVHQLQNLYFALIGEELTIIK